jgi:hypothetical protein
MVVERGKLSYLFLASWRMFPEQSALENHPLVPRDALLGKVPIPEFPIAHLWRGFLS